jgi:hypothetical protein
MFEKKVFRFFGPFCARSASKFAKSANMTTKIICSTNFDMGVRKREFDADFTSVEKVVNNFLFPNIYIKFSKIK